jgi:hypothetical protein
MTATDKRRLFKFLNSLALKPVRTCKSLHHCNLCQQSITLGQTYRDGGVDRRAHDSCFHTAVEGLR